MILVNNQNTDNPFVNLAIEDYLVRNADTVGYDYLFLYINRPCIVTGKNQSIYKEVNFEYLRNGKVDLCRRISGGGTVYQDKGNLNFAFIQKFEEYKVNNYGHFNKPVVDALNKAGIKASMDARNNILCEGKKISGNAQFTNRKNIISHGTLLFNADVGTLRVALRENEFEIESKAVGSVRSAVMNIADAGGSILSVEELKTYLQTELKANDVFNFTEQQWSEIELLAKEKFESFEWVYGRSPKTIIRKKEVTIEVEEGRIQQIQNSPARESGMKQPFKVQSYNLDTGNLLGEKYKYNQLQKLSGDLLALFYF